MKQSRYVDPSRFTDADAGLASAFSPARLPIMPPPSSRLPIMPPTPYPRVPKMSSVSPLIPTPPLASPSRAVPVFALFPFSER